jgi:hypothetical protein
MATATHTQSADALLSALVDQAIERGVSAQVAQNAAEAALRGLRLPPGPPSAQTRRRIEAYYTAVVRKRAVRRGQPARGAAYFVIASVVEDLAQSGRSQNEIWDELERGWSRQVPAEVLEEYRVRLCG